MKYALLIAAIAFGLNVIGQITPTYDDILIPMRDNEFLEADVYIPAGADSCEVILIQTPYDKDNFEASLPMGVGTDIDNQPFAWVIVDWRGFYGSNGANTSNFERGEDGYDICEWIVDQPWHRSRIGTWGPSALGGVQYHTAREQHPNHTCAVPLVAHPQQSYDSYFYGGVLEEARLQTLDLLGYGLSPIILSNVYHNLTWQFSENGSWYPSDIHIPTLQIGGWYDYNIDKMMDWYEATRTSAAPTVQDEQWLLVGPWVHGGTGAAYVGSSTQGELNYPNAEYMSDTMAWEFFEFYLLDATNNWDLTDKITYYEMGTDQWLSSNSTNIAETTSETIYLDATNKLGPTSGYGSTAFISDPSNPSPTIGGATLHVNLDQGPYDQISLESRNDVITFETEVLPTDISTTGRIGLDLYVSSDQPDCDIAVRLVDVYPDGRNMLINDGIRRMRFRNGYTQADEAFMTPGQIYPVHIDLPFTSYTWLSGHRIKIYISGNHSIRWNVNLQDGGTMYQTGTGNNANITIHHNATHPSSVEIPGINPTLGSSELQHENFGIYPNPAHDLLHISSNDHWDAIKVIDLNGRILLQHSFTPTVDINQLAAGSYIIQLTDGDVIRQSKFNKY